MRVVGLEEERLARSKDTELAGTAGLPKIYLCHPWLGSQETVPTVICHPYVRPHNDYCAPAIALASRNPAIAAW
jgi:hypothetical protein